MYYAKNRYYSPSRGGFNRVDPIRDGYNCYGYCNGDPVNNTDPWGLARRPKDPLDINSDDFVLNSHSTDTDGGSGTGDGTNGDDDKEEGDDQEKEENKVDTDGDGITDADEEKIKENLGYRIYYIVKALASLGKLLDLSHLGEGDDLGLSSILEQIKNLTVNDDRLRLKVLMRAGIYFMYDNRNRDEVDLLGFLYEIDIIMFNTGDKELSYFEKSMIALDVAMVLTFSSDESVKETYGRFKKLIKFSSKLSKEEKKRLLSCLEFGKKNAHDINIQKRIKDVNYMKTEMCLNIKGEQVISLNAGKWKIEYLDSQMPHANNSHHFAAYLFSSLMIGKKNSMRLVKWIDGDNPGDINMSQIAVDAAYDNLIWESPSIWLMDYHLLVFPIY